MNKINNINRHLHSGLVHKTPGLFYTIHTYYKSNGIEAVGIPAICVFILLFLSLFRTSTHTRTRERTSASDGLPILTSAV